MCFFFTVKHLSDLTFQLFHSDGKTKHMKINVHSIIVTFFNESSVLNRGLYGSRINYDPNGYILIAKTICHGNHFSIE